MQARARADAWRRLEEDPELAQKKLAADAWCAAFVQPKSLDHGQGITHDTIRQIVENPGSVPDRCSRNGAGDGSAVPLLPLAPGVPRHLHGSGLRHCRVDPITGWQGGFSCVVGNPPWERVKIQDKEFFASVGRNDIAEAKTAAIRRKMIDALSADDPACIARHVPVGAPDIRWNKPSAAAQRPVPVNRAR